MNRNKNMFLDIMIVFIKQKLINIKWEKSNKLTLFLQRLSVSKILLKIDKKSYKHIDIYNIGYITFKKIDDCEKIYSVNPLYLLIDHTSGYIKIKGVNKYLVFDSTDKNKELLKNIMIFGMELRTKSKN